MPTLKEKQKIRNTCMICNKPFEYIRLSTYQIRVTCGKKECSKKARSVVTPGRPPWRSTNNIRTFYD